MSHIPGVELPHVVEEILAGGFQVAIRRKEGVRQLLVRFGRRALAAPEPELDLPALVREAVCGHHRVLVDLQTEGTDQTVRDAALSQEPLQSPELLLMRREAPVAPALDDLPTVWI